MNRDDLKARASEAINAVKFANGQTGNVHFIAAIMKAVAKDVLILDTPEALAASATAQAMIREAEARGMERAANMVALAPLAHLPHSPGAVAFFADPTATLNDAAAAILAEAAAIRKGEPT